MALQELTKRELAGLIAGASAANAIIGRVSEEEPEELPKDEIWQWEIRALYHLEAAKDALALSFKRRLEAGASVEPGPYYLESDGQSLDDLRENRPGHEIGSFNVAGFNFVGWSDPSKAEIKVGGKPHRRRSRKGQK